ncbi:chorismate-binding protein [Shigella flexneri]
MRRNERKRADAGLPAASHAGAERFPASGGKQVIAELEPFDRELFGGIVGWCDSEGNGEWVVTIRCAR